MLTNFVVKDNKLTVKTEYINLSNVVTFYKITIFIALKNELIVLWYLQININYETFKKSSNVNYTINHYCIL